MNVAEHRGFALTGFRSTFKNSDVEELVDYWVHRPVAAIAVGLLSRLPVTPNQVTVLSGVVGLAAGWTIAVSPVGRWWQVPLGGLLLFASVVLDCADGQLARLRGQSSMAGRMLDGVVDVFPTAAVFVGFAQYSSHAGHDARAIYALAALAGVSMRWHVHAYDHAKNVYLANVLPPGDRSKPLPSFEEIARERDAHRARGDWFGALVLAGFLRFTRAQRRGWQGARIGVGAAKISTEYERNAYRNVFRRLMRLWTFEGLGTHLCIFVVAALTTPVFRDSAVVAWLVIAGPMNLLALYLEHAERRIESEFLASLRPSGAATA